MKTELWDSIRGCLHFATEKMIIELNYILAATPYFIINDRSTLTCFVKNGHKYIFSFFTEEDEWEEDLSNVVFALIIAYKDGKEAKND
jgi:hypothetical protein